MKQKINNIVYKKYFKGELGITVASGHTPTIESTIKHIFLFPSRKGNISQ